MTSEDKASKKSPNVTARCKMCGTPLPPSNKPGASPFCSERCRLNDLSKWFGENYRIPTNQAPINSGEEEKE